MYALDVLIVAMLLLLQPQLLLHRSGVMGAAVHSGDELLNETEPQVQENIFDFSTCYDSDLETTLSKQRLDVFRQEILSKLNFDHEPENPPDDLVIGEDVLANYHAALALDGARQGPDSGREMQDECGEKETFYAKEVMLHFPSQFTREIPSTAIFDWGPLSNDKKIKRSAEKEDYKISEKEKEHAFYPPPPHEHFSESLSPDYRVDSLSQYVSPINYSLNFADISIPAHVTLWSVNLRLYKRKIISDNSVLKRTSNPTETIEVYYISTIVGIDGKPVTHRALIASHSVQTEDDGYVSFDITHGIKYWLHDWNRTSQLDIEVFIRCPESVSTGLKFLPSVKFDVPYPDSKENNNAQLVFKFLTGEITRNDDRRIKRELNPSINSEYCLSTPDEINCCLRELTINFRKHLNWTWIIAPATIKTNYCQGLCPALWPSATMSTSFLNRLRLTNPTSSPEPCCVAQKVKPLTILIAIEGQLYLSRLQDVIVDSCICR